MTSTSSSSSTTSSDAPTDDRPRPVWCPEQQIYLGGIVPGATNEDVQALLANNHGALPVFGYGSLCWNPGNPADTALGHASVTSHLGYAKGYHRAWAQKSTDHRGVARFPGIVCTLLQQREVDAILHLNTNNDDNNGETTASENPFSSRTEGMIYVVPPELAQTCLEELDFREKGGYAREIITVVQHDKNEDGSSSEPKEVQALLYRGTPDNPAFWPRLLWDLPLAAAVMAVSVGPSGPNDVYLNQLNEFLLQQQTSDNHQNQDDDTCTLAKMTKTLQQRHLALYFFYGSGSNQHGQIRMLDKGETRNIYDTEDYFQLMESVICCKKDESASGEGTCTKPDPPKAILAGGGHSGLLTRNGQLYLWGWNENGQCGKHSDQEDASVEDSPLPIIESLPDIRVETAALGFAHTLVIEKNTGRLYAFGDDSHGQVTGQLDDPKTLLHVSSPQTPAPVLQDTFQAISAGLFHSAAITIQGELVTFGSAKHGQSLSNEGGSANTVTGRWMPPDGSKLVDVVCGRHHTAVVDERGRVWTFGDNKYGQLGRQIQNNDDHSSESTKKRVPHHDPVPQLVDGALGRDHDGQLQCAELKSGWSHMVARVSRQDSTGIHNGCIYGWGRSDKGQLGCQEKTVPVPCRLHGLGTKKTKNVCCGSESTYFLVTENDIDSVYSCGWNEHGNLALPLLEEDDVFDVTAAVTDVSKLVSPLTYSSEPTEDRSFLMAAGGGHFLAMLV